jgi:hypothetical protein
VLRSIKTVYLSFLIIIALFYGTMKASSTMVVGRRIVQVKVRRTVGVMTIPLEDMYILGHFHKTNEMDTA